MQKGKMIVGLIMVASLILGAGTLAFGKNHKVKDVKFKVRVENISTSEQLNLSGSKYPFALSPGMFVVSEREMPLFKLGKKAGKGVEAQAEDGNPGILADELKTVVGSVNMGVFNTPLGASGPAPILPGGAYEFEFTASEGMRFTLAAMYGQSNDLFYAPAKSIKLFNGGQPLSGDITDKFLLWDAGTEVNEEPGTGVDQAPRQKGPNTGASENGVIKYVNDGFKYPDTKSVLRVTITPVN